MTNKEYEKKKLAISVSSAHPCVKHDAMVELNNKFYGHSSKDRAMKLIQESAPDLPKGDD